MLLSSNRKYAPFPMLSYFSLVVCLRCLLHQILSLIACTFRENWEFVFIVIVQFMMSANSRVRFGLQIVFVCLCITPSHYHHCANYSEDFELIKCLSDIFCECVRLSVFSQLSNIQYVGLCVFSSPTFMVMIEKIYMLFSYHHQIASITHCLGIGHETIVCAVCLTIFLWIPDMTGLLRGTFVSWLYLPRTLACSIATMLGTLLIIDTKHIWFHRDIFAS